MAGWVVCQVGGRAGGRAGGPVQQVGRQVPVGTVGR